MKSMPEKGMNKPWSMMTKWSHDGTEIDAQIQKCLSKTMPKMVAENDAKK